MSFISFSLAVIFIINLPLFNRNFGVRAFDQERYIFEEADAVRI